MKTLGLVLTLTCFGCAGTFEETRAAAHPTVQLAPRPPECPGYAAGERDWGAVALGAGFLAGGTGLAQIPDYGSRAATIGLAAGTVVAGTTAVVAAAESKSFGNAWARECSQ